MHRIARIPDVFFVALLQKFLILRAGHFRVRVVV